MKIEWEYNRKMNHTVKKWKLFGRTVWRKTFFNIPEMATITKEFKFTYGLGEVTMCITVPLFEYELENLVKHPDLFEQMLPEHILSMIKNR